MTEPRRIICDAIAAEFTNDAALVLSDRIIRALGQAGWGFVPLGPSNPVWTATRWRGKGHLTVIDGDGEG